MPAKELNKQGYLISLPWQLNHVGGVNEVVKNLIEQLKKSEIYTPILHSNVWKKTATETEYRHIQTPLVNPPKNIKEQLKYYFYHLPKSLVLWVKYIKTHNITVINIHYPVESCFFFSLLKKIFNNKIEIIISLHGLDLEHMLKGSKSDWLPLLHHTKQIVTCSKYLKEQFLIQYNEFAHKTTFIHNAIDPSALNKECCSGQSLMSKEQTYFINVATFEYKKGQDIILKAYANFRQRFPEAQEKLVLIGRHTDYIDELNTFIKQNNLQAYVKIFTNVPHKHTIATIANASLFLLPSRKEPFGIVLLEAGFVNVPVIAHATGGVPEFVTHKKTGILLTENTEKEWTQSLLDYKDIALKQYAANFAQLIMKQYTWQQVASQYTNLLKQN